MMTLGPESLMMLFLVFMTEIHRRHYAAGQIQSHFHRRHDKDYITKISYIYLLSTVKRVIIMSI